MRGFGGSRRGPPTQWAAHPEWAARDRWDVGVLPLAELLPLDVGPELLGHDRGSNGSAAEYGLERVLAAFEADVITAERLLALRHVFSSLRLKVSRDVLERQGYYYHRHEGEGTENPTRRAVSPTAKYPLPLWAQLALSGETRASPRARTSAAAP